MTERALTVRDFAAEAVAAAAAEARAAAARVAAAVGGGDGNSDDSGDVCGVCLDTAEQPEAQVSPCGHVFCKNCITEALQEDKRCVARLKLLFVV